MRFWFPGAITEPDAHLIAAAFLHDTVEDTAPSREELVQAFGVDVAGLVLEVDDKTLPDGERKRRQVEHASHLSFRAQIIKLAEKISKLKSILSTPPKDGILDGCGSTLPGEGEWWMG